VSGAPTAGRSWTLVPRGGAAPVPRRILAQAAFDTRMLLRNGEQLLLSLVLPLLLLVVLARTSVLPLPPGARLDELVPGVLAVAVLSTAFTGQAIATGFDRRYGVLRLLGTTPLGRSGLLAGRALAVLAVEAVQVVLLSAVALTLGWQPVPTAAALGAAAVVLALGTVCLVALGLLLAGLLRAEAVLAAANLVWVLLVAGGGMVVASDRLPGVLAVLAPLLPSGALADGLRAALAEGRLDVAACAVLLAWAAAAALGVARTFRWD
jgi:ABC-2 type transport system permease protein